MDIPTIFGYVLLIHWSIVTTFILIGIIGFLFYKSKKSADKADNYEIVIISKASTHIKNALYNCMKLNNNRFKKLGLVIDEGSDLQDELIEYTKQNKIDLYIVPKSFKCKAIAKGRAIQYFIHINVKDLERWYMFIDDDNIIQDSIFLHEINYYDKKGYGAFNAVIYPKKSSSGITYIADFLRYFDDLTIFRFGTGLLGKPINGMHGELLGIKGKVLKSIGFDRETITEDFAFSRELLRKGIKTWQSETTIQILSPHTIKDFLTQRKRWFNGNSRDVLSAPLAMKLFAGIKIYDWRIGIIGSWLIFPLWFILPFNIPLALKVYSSLGMVYYLLVYIYGSFKAEEGKLKLGFLLTPLYSTMENLSPYYWNGKHKNEFEVIRK